MRMMKSPRWLVGLSISLAVMTNELVFPQSHNLFAFFLGQASMVGLFLLWPQSETACGEKEQR